MWTSPTVLLGQFDSLSFQKSLAVLEMLTLITFTFKIDIGLKFATWKSQSDVVLVGQQTHTIPLKWSDGFVWNRISMLSWYTNNICSAENRLHWGGQSSKEHYFADYVQHIKVDIPFSWTKTEIEAFRAYNLFKISQKSKSDDYIIESVQSMTSRPSPDKNVSSWPPSGTNILERQRFPVPFIKIDKNSIKELSLTSCFFLILWSQYITSASH